MFLTESNQLSKKKESICSDYSPTHTSSVAEQLRPATSEELVGNEDAIQSMKNWIRTWTNNKALCHTTHTPMLLLHGPPGCGKTTAAYVILQSLGYVVSEINASITPFNDLKEWFGVAVMTYHGLKKRDRNGKLLRAAVLLDEVDGLHRGSNYDETNHNYFSWMWNLVDSPKRYAPIICTCNDRYRPSMRQICKRSHIIDFYQLKPMNLMSIANRAIKLFKVQIELDQLQTIINNTNGDARALINDIHLYTLNPNMKSSTLRDRIPSDFKICSMIFCCQLPPFNKLFTFSSLNTGLKYLHTNFLHALEKTAYNSDYNNLKKRHTTDLHRCEAIEIITENLSFIDVSTNQNFGLGFDFTFLYETALLATVQVAYNKSELIPPNSHFLGQLKFPYARRLKKNNFANRNRFKEEELTAQEKLSFIQEELNWSQRK